MSDAYLYSFRHSFSRGPGPKIQIPEMHVPCTCETAGSSHRADVDLCNTSASLADKADDGGPAHVIGIARRMSKAIRGK